MGKRYIYRIIIEPDDERFHAEIPALPGCYSWGYTYDEALTNIKEAAELWLEILAEDGEPIPEEDPKVLLDAPPHAGALACGADVLAAALTTVELAAGYLDQTGGEKSPSPRRRNHRPQSR
jgi:predicted RNase H-like HicB family nuclease